MTKNIKINKYLINILDSKWLFYNLIYNLRLIELKIFKTKFKINLANNKFFVTISILSV